MGFFKSVIADSRLPVGGPASIPLPASEGPAARDVSSPRAEAPHPAAGTPVAEAVVPSVDRDSGPGPAERAVPAAKADGERAVVEQSCGVAVPQPSPPVGEVTSTRVETPPQSTEERPVPPVRESAPDTPAPVLEREGDEELSELSVPPNGLSPRIETAPVSLSSQLDLHTVVPADTETVNCPGMVSVPAPETVSGPVPGEGREATAVLPPVAESSTMEATRPPVPESAVPAAPNTEAPTPSSREAAVPSSPLPKPQPPEPSRRPAAAPESRPARPAPTAPQVRIGQVNVIVEGPPEPRTQPKPARSEDLSSRLFLRTL